MSGADVPIIDPTTEGYWRAAAGGRLVAISCGSCGAISNYPRPFCPACWSEDVAEVPLSGRAVLYAFSVVHSNPMPPFSDLVPYVAALVDLDEGPRMMTRLVGVDPADVRVGMGLEAAFEPRGDDWGLVLFQPAD